MSNISYTKDESSSVESETKKDLCQPDSKSKFWSGPFMLSHPLEYVFLIRALQRVH